MSGEKDAESAEALGPKWLGGPDESACTCEPVRAHAWACVGMRAHAWAPVALRLGCQVARPPCRLARHQEALPVG